MIQFIISLVWIIAWVFGIWMLDCVVGMQSHALWAMYGAIMAMILRRSTTI